MPSVPNLLSRLWNIMIWVIIDECSEPIKRSCETLIGFVSRGRWSPAPFHLAGCVCVCVCVGGGDRRFKERAHLHSSTTRHVVRLSERRDNFPD